jgi:dephospho-CoA kinase
LESVRAVGEVDSLRAKGDFYLFAIDADPSFRYDRIRLRNNETDHVSYDKFISDEQKEFANEDPTQGNIQRCMQLADFSFDNNGTLEGLHQQIDEAMKTIQK